MFCPYCGLQMADGSAFCTNCGKQIGNSAAPFAAQQQKGGLSQKKIIVIAAAIVCLIAVVSVIVLLSRNSASTQNDGYQQSARGAEANPSGAKKEGFHSVEELFDAFFTAAYSNDVEGAIACFPKEMESFAKRLFNAYRNEDYKYKFDYPGAEIFGFINLNTGNEYSYEIVRTIDIESGEGLINYYVTKESLQADFGLTVDEVFYVELRTTAKIHTADGGNMSDSVRSYPQVARIGDEWYIVRGHDLWNGRWME